MKKKGILLLFFSFFCVISVLGLRTYANELNKPTKTNDVVNYRYTAEVHKEGLEDQNFQAPKQLTVNHYVNSDGSNYSLFMQEKYFNTNIGFKFYPKDHYYPFEKFTEVMNESKNDLPSDDSFWLDQDYTGPLTINYYYVAELDKDGMEVNNFLEPKQLTVNHYLDGGYNKGTMQLFMQETYFNTNANFMFYPEDHYYPFERFTETGGKGTNDLSSDDPFWAKLKK